MDGPGLHVPGLHWSGDGCAALSGALLARLGEIDGLVAGRAARFGAIEHRFPAVIALESLAPVGWLRSFPHLATFATTVRNNPQALQECARSHGTATSIQADPELLAPSGHVLAPAGCYHVYHRFAGAELPAPLLVSLRCDCHRNEQHYLPLRRQWCFTMREVVCIGDEAAIERFVGACRNQLETLLHRLDLDAGWRPAADPFFDPDNDPSALAQRIAPTKEELCLEDGLAIASINRHRRWFGESYGICCGNGIAHSACVALGLERWLCALMQRYGADAAAWPSLASLS